MKCRRPHLSWSHWFASLLTQTRLVLLLGLLSEAAYAQRPQLRLDLLPASGPASDPTYLYFQQGATTGFDANFDATKLPNTSGLNLASFEASGQQLAINGLPLTVLQASFTVGLFVGGPQYATYSLQVSQLDSLPTTEVYLLDNLQNSRTLLALGATYAFELTAANTAGTYATSTRFALLFQPAPGPLPVTLTSFTAVGQSLGVRVAWHTAAEWQSQYFAVERSADGQAFGEIGRVAAAGTSTQPHAYALLDAQPLASVAYYRLRQTDLDGHWQYSPVRVVAGPVPEGRLHLFPVPARATATLLGAPPGERVLVREVSGRVVATATADAAGTAAFVLPSGLASGVYLVQAGGQMTRLVVE